MTIEAISVKYSICYPTMCKILREFRIKPYSKQKLFSPDLIEDYFEKIDTEHKAYFLGLIVSDGCLHSKKGRPKLVCLTLKDEDRYILEAFLTEIKSNKKITSDNRGYSSIQISSEKMGRDLMQYGIALNKGKKQKCDLMKKTPR